MITIESVPSPLASKLCQRITADLPEYFGLPEVNEHYIQGMLSRHSFAAKNDNEYIGLITLEFPYPTNANIYWLGIMRKYHHQGVGTKLMQSAERYALANNAITMTVETLTPSAADAN